MALNIDTFSSGYSKLEYHQLLRKNKKINVLLKHSHLIFLLCIISSFLHDNNFLICNATSVAPSTVVHVDQHKTESPFVAAAEAAVAAAFGSLTSETSPHPTSGTTTTTVSHSTTSKSAHPHIKSSSDQHHIVKTSKPATIEEASKSVVEKVVTSTTPTPVGKLSEAKKSLIDDLVAELRDKQVQEIANELSSDKDKLDKIKITSTTTIATTIRPGSNVEVNKTTGKLISEGEFVQHMSTHPSGGDIKLVSPPPAMLATVNVVDPLTQHPNQTHVMNNEPLVLIEQQQQNHVQQQVPPTHIPSLMVKPTNETPSALAVVPVVNNTVPVVAPPVAIPSSPPQPSLAQINTRAGESQSNLDNKTVPASVNVNLASSETNNQAVNVNITMQELDKPVQSHLQAPAAIPAATPISATTPNPNISLIPIIKPSAALDQPPATSPSIYVSASVGNAPTLPPITSVPAVVAAAPSSEHLLNITVKSDETIAGTNQHQVMVANASIEMAKTPTTVGPTIALIPHNNNLTAIQPVLDTSLNKKSEPPPMLASTSLKQAKEVPHIPATSEVSPPAGPILPGFLDLPTVAPILPNLPPPPVAPLAHLITSAINTPLGQPIKTETAPTAVFVEAHASTSAQNLKKPSSNLTSNVQASVVNQPSNATSSNSIANITITSTPAVSSKPSNLHEPTPTKHVNITLNIAPKTTTASPAITISSSNKTQANAKITNSTVAIDEKGGKRTVIVVDKAAIKTTLPTSTTTTKPSSKPKKKLNSLDSKLLKLKSKFAAANIHDVIVVGDHVDGDDMFEDYDDHSEHHKEHKDAKDDDNHHEHHDSKELVLEHGETKSTTKMPASIKPSSSKGIEIDVSKKDKTKISIKSEGKNEAKKEEKEKEDHEDHEHLLKGLGLGDVIHIDVGVSKTKKHSMTKHPQVTIKNIINKTVVVSKENVNATTSGPHQIVTKVKPKKKKIQRIIKKHKRIKHPNPGNLTSVPIVNVTSTATTLLPANGTKTKHKYKLVKIIKRKKKPTGSISTHAPNLGDVTTTITKINSTNSRVVVKIKKTSKKPILLSNSTTTSSPKSKNQETPLGKALSLAIAAASESVAKEDGSLSSKTITVSRDVLFGNQTTNGSSLVNKISGPNINKELIECLTRERLAKSGLSLDSQVEIDSQRFDMILKRQQTAARQIRLANRVSGSMIRESFDNEVTDRLAESELKRHDELRRQTKFREQLRDRLSNLRMRFSDIVQ